MSMVGFPLLLIPLAIYNMIVFLMPGVAFSETLLRVQLVSGEIWTISLGDMLLGLGVLLLLLEIIKAAKPGGKYLTDHLLSFLVFGGAAAEFVMWPKFGNSTFLLLALLAMVDFFAGVSLRTRRSARAAAAPGAAPAPVPAPPVEEPVPAAPAARAAPEPHFEPVAHEAPQPEPDHAVVEESTDAVPAAASVAESVLLDRSVPRPAAPASPSAEHQVPPSELETEVAGSASSEHPKQPDTPKT